MKLIGSPYRRLHRIINNRVFQHLLYWIVYVCFFGFIWGTYDYDFRKTFSIELVSLPAKVLFVYFIIYFLMPAYLFKGRRWQFCLLFFLSLLVASVMLRVLDNYVVIDFFLPHWIKSPLLNPITLLSATLKLMAVLTIPAMVNLMNNFSRIQRRQQELEKEKLEADLNFLKNQIHPHFLFNSLNSLYSLMLKKSDDAIDFFLQLSALLRYLLYESNTQRNELQKEVDFVKSYLELERVRFGSSANIVVRERGEFANKYIAPMLIIPFVENSVKHSTGEYGKKTEIMVEMAVEQDYFILQVSNNIAIKMEVEGTKGIGLQNVRKRLDILYENNYHLDINESPNQFTVLLKIKL
jgi:two-component system LytT family sensor kinase